MDLMTHFARIGGHARPALLAAAVLFGACPIAYSQRLLGIDVSAWQDNISVANWNTLHTTNNRDFVFVRSSRGGTTGFDRNHDNIVSSNAICNGVSTDICLSRRYDDPYFGQNMTRATNAGLFAGSYHRSRADILADSPNTGGVANNGTDEANHMIEMAGAWMRPGYLPPVLDFEDGAELRTDVEMAQFALDFSNRIYAVKGIRPAIYINGNYAQNVLAGGTASQRAQLAQQPPNTPTVVSPAFPTLWSARWPNGSGNQYTGIIQTDHPTNGFANIYGPWDDYGVADPWAFWQYSSGERLSGYANGGKNIDGNVAKGDIEFVKDQLIPALWWGDSSGDWSTLTNWNSGQPVVAPVVAPNQTPVQGSTTLPVARLPGAAGSGPTSGQNDTVILERPNANITVTLSTGTHNIRKLYVRESLDITGGSLTVNYDPNYISDTVNYPNAVRSGPLTAQFSGAVSLSGTGSLSAHTIQVDTTRTFTLGGGTLTFNTLNLMPHNSQAGRIAMTGDVTFQPLNNATATIKAGGAGVVGPVDLNGGNRTFFVGNGSADVDLSVDVSIINGGFTKDGEGTMRLGAAIQATGPVTINGGTLRYGHSSGLSSTSVVTINNSGILDMNNFSDTIAGLASAEGDSSGTVERGSANLTLSGGSGTNAYSGVVTGTGTLVKNGGSTQILNGNNSFGPVTIGGGALVLNGFNATGAVTVNGGTLGGNAIVTGATTVKAGAKLAPGASIGTFVSGGGLTVETGAILEFELGTPGTSDLIGVGNLSLLGGTLNLIDAGGLAAGNYNLFNYVSLNGSVDNLGTPIGPEGFNYDLVDTGTAINLAVTAIVTGVPGDFNGDDMVDAADYVVWREHEGTETPLLNDDNIGGVVGPAHYSLWMANFGRTLGSGGQATAMSGVVPEPSSLLLLTIVAATIGCVNRRRR